MLTFFGFVFYFFYFLSLFRCNLDENSKGCWVCIRGVCMYYVLYLFVTYEVGLVEFW